MYVHYLLLLDETEYDMKNYADPEGLFDNTLQDLHNVIQKKPNPVIDFKFF